MIVRFAKLNPVVKLIAGVTGVTGVTVATVATVATIVTAISVLPACATRPTLTENSSTMIDPTSAGTVKLPNVPAKFSTGMADYKYKEKSYKAEWMRCNGHSDAPFVALIHDETAGFDPKDFCQTWQAQVLLANTLNVIAVNRPGFGSSTGAREFAGPQSLAAATAAIQASGSQDRLAGIWGYGTGSITAAFLAKSQPRLSWLMLGNGFYDLEVVERSTKNEGIAAAIAAAKSSEGDAALERRSIAWDNNGLPKLVIIYHAKSDDVAPRSQADAFSDQLRTMQTRVFFDDIDGIGHDIPWQAHYQIADRALKKRTIK
jgi:hypothetical protein